jgi:hypothetical protein
MAQEFLVVGNHNKLEVCLLLTGTDDIMERLSQGPNIVPVQVGGGFVKRNQTAIDAETLC